MAHAGRESAAADAIGLYLEAVSSHNLLTAEDEVRLARTVERGIEAQVELASSDDLAAARRVELVHQVRLAQQAKKQFIRCNLRLVISIAKRYTGRGLDLLVERPLPAQLFSQRSDREF